MVSTVVPLMATYLFFLPIRPPWRTSGGVQYTSAKWGLVE